MAVKYRLQVNSQKEQDWLVEIDFPTYDGDPIETVGIENPIQIEYSSGSNDDPYASHIIQQSATFQLYSDVIDVEELQTLPDGDVRCRVYYNSQLKHSGFIISDGIQEADSGVATPVTIKSIDGLSFLEDIRYFITNYGSITINGQASSLRCPMNFIRAALYSTSNLNNPLPIKWSTELRSEQYPADDMLAGRNTIGNDGKIMLEFEYSVMWYLDNILKTARCWLYQKDGFWYIEDKVKTTKDGGIMNGWQITASTTSQVATALSEDLNTGELSGQFIIEDSYWMVKKPLGGINATYQSSVNSENILPNGGFDEYSTGTLLDWRILPSVGSDATLTQHESLTEREGSAVELVNSSSATSNGIFALNYPIPMDTKVLFKSILFGFTLLPLNGFPLNETGFIKWQDRPFRITVNFTYKGEIYYLNEFGYWWKNAGETYQNIISAIHGSPNIYTVSFHNDRYFSPGEIVRIRVVRDGVLQTYTIPINEVLDPLSGIQYIASQIPNASASGASVTTLKYITLNGVTNSPQNLAEMYYESDYSRYIYPTIDSSKIGDISGFQFTGKGGNSEILMPQIENYSDLSSADGMLNVIFEIKPGQRYVLDDAYVRLQNNNDVYEIRDTSSKSPVENKEVGISSSFSGFMLSNYMVNYGQSNRSLYWTGTKSLTQIYGESILNWRNTPCKIYEGSIDRIIQGGDFITVKGINYHVLNAVIQGDGITKVTAFEAKWNPKTYSVTHKGSNKDEEL